MVCHDWRLEVVMDEVSLLLWFFSAEVGAEIEKRVARAVRSSLGRNGLARERW